MSLSTPAESVEQELELMASFAEQVLPLAGE